MKSQPKENPLINIMVNIFLPVMVLNQSAKWQHPLSAEILLVVALALPLGYGLWDWVKFRRRNYISALGVFNVLLTGGFALFELSPFWFVVKEATFPFVLGVGVLLSNWLGDRPFFETLLRDSGTLHWEQVDEALVTTGRTAHLKRLFRNCNFGFATSFFLSALLNFALAQRVFQLIPSDLNELERKQMLNEQIAQMTWQGWVVIAIPLMIFMMGIFWYFFSALKTMTGLDLETLTKSKSDQSVTS